MTAHEIMAKLFALAKPQDWSECSDTCKEGDPNFEINQVAVTMFPTVDVIRAAADWGAELLIVHEPLYYNHMDEHSDEPIECQKRELIEQTGMTVWRFHDHAHATNPDLIAAGQLCSLALPGEIELTTTSNLCRVHLNEPMTPRELKTRMEEKWGLRNIRVCGSTDKPCRHISCMFGAPGNRAFEELRNPNCDILLIGETREWILGEYARDAEQLGYTKALFILGHVGSEREGMVYITDLLKEMFPELTVKYFECEEVY